jgi:hypothetical protein
MRPIFTIHAGEYLVGKHIEEYGQKSKDSKELRVWIPSKDTGIDLLVTHREHSKFRPIGLQVKFSKHYDPTVAKSALDKIMIAGGWVKLLHDKIENSKADYWIFVIISSIRGTKPEFIVIPPDKLLEKLVATHTKNESYHFYPQILENKKAIDGRNLTPSEKNEIVNGNIPIARDLSCYLNNWEMLDHLNSAKNKF